LISRRAAVAFLLHSLVQYLTVGTRGMNGRPQNAHAR